METIKKISGAVLPAAGAALVTTVIAMGVAYLLSIGIGRQEEAECYQWQSQSLKYQGFYLTQWQSEQCKVHGIVINAPVK
ncbi:MAG: hypothetical protein KGJ13_08750 [Patescibacteria group bacterium]|nr:hypothetical protein [Patescibacteria group bacterium]